MTSVDQVMYDHLCRHLLSRYVVDPHEERSVATSLIHLKFCVTDEMARLSPGNEVLCVQHNVSAEHKRSKQREDGARGTPQI